MLFGSAKPHLSVFLMLNLNPTANPQFDPQVETILFCFSSSPQPIEVLTITFPVIFIFTV